jgi:hypothetical protein
VDSKKRGELSSMSRNNVGFWVAMRQKSSPSEAVSTDDNCDLNEALRCS